ncbi:hypothetical protein BVRB_9g220020 [Beta vulgaris subsp. vulgaris]|nr:hypothetical protein BVRB_9g220020 [Beta vulgaris subsp. vulgaris]
MSSEVLNDCYGRYSIQMIAYFSILVERLYRTETSHFNQSSLVGQIILE